MINQENNVQISPMQIIKKGGELFLRRTRRVLSLNCLKSFCSNHYE